MRVQSCDVVVVVRVTYGSRCIFYATLHAPGVEHAALRRCTGDACYGSRIVA